MSSGPAAVVVVGIGADGWAGLAEPARAALRSAQVVIGGPRQLGLLPEDLTAQRVALPKPLAEGLPAVLEAHAGREIRVLASGDPMHHGIGATLVRLLGPAAVAVISHPGSVSLACARLGWSVEDVEVVSAVGRPVDRLRFLAAPGARVMVLSNGAQTPQAVCALLRESGFGPSEVTVLEQLGGPAERRTTARADVLTPPPDGFDPLNLVAVDVVADPGTDALPRTPGLPDEAYLHDGQLTKRDIRAVTLARLAPRTGQLLWDVGGGAGSIGIEWLRSARHAAAIAVEQRPDRATRMTANAAALGVPQLQVVLGRAPQALTDLPTPDAIFVGGGGSDPAVLDACWAALRPGGRLVANAVTLQTESALVARCTELGGDLIRLEVSHAVALGRFTGWHAEHPVTQWAAIKPLRPTNSVR